MRLAGVVVLALAARAQAQAVAGSAAAAHACGGYDEEWGTCPGLSACTSCQPVDCQFSPWGHWYTAGGCVGLRFRQRTVRTPSNECGLPCAGVKIQSEEFVMEKCEYRRQDCQLSPWSKWSRCASRTDQSTRTRAIEQLPSHDGQPCAGGIKETRACGGGGRAPAPCQFAQWREWTTCSATCGEGIHSRMRHIRVESRNGGAPCSDAILETQRCTARACPSRDCSLSNWSGWSACNGDDSQRMRHRRVLVAPLNGGVACPPQLVETEGCPKAGSRNSVSSAWTSWTQCDKTCMGGQSYRERKVDVRGSQGYDGVRFVLKETTPCNTISCWAAAEGDCILAPWSGWSACSASCSAGAKRRERRIDALARARGRGCLGPTTEVAPCNAGSCDTSDCEWSTWEEWSACSCSCGGGSKRRSRVVATAPKAGGLACDPKDLEEVAPCHTQACDQMCADGFWGQWMAWTRCSTTCSGGFKSRRRDVQVQPSECGRPVSGLREQFAVCLHLPPCARDRDCELSPWGHWTPCSSECLGLRTRSRRVAVFAAGAGMSCEAPLEGTEPCSPGRGAAGGDRCGEPQEDCLLGAWAAWSPCTSHCGGGQRARRRTVLQAERGGGLPCEGSLVVTVPCSTQPCPVMGCQDCQWGSWSDWGECSGCEGQRLRHRFIEKLPNHCGRACEAQMATEMSNCTAFCENRFFCVWTPWSDATPCSGCGLSTTLRNRALSLSTAKHLPDSFLFKGDKETSCVGTQLNVSECPHITDCTPRCKPRDCSFSAWSEWKEPTCDGLCERRRVLVQLNNECGAPCEGQMVDTKECPTECSPKRDCIVAQWEEWTGCRSGNQKFRFRNITQQPESGGAPCTGMLQETTGCTTSAVQSCQFSAWWSWDDCSRRCGTGWKARARKIIVPAKGGGVQCNGTIKELHICTSWGPDCDNQTKQDCIMAAWAHWGVCNKDGQRYRTRAIDRQPKNGGAPCNGTLKETQTCRLERVDCRTSSWTDWDDCDRDCGGGQTHRQRQVHQFPANDGKPCPAELIQTKGCNVRSCDLKDCKVSEWQDWEPCSVTCGVGIRERSRKVLSLRSYAGDGCLGSLKQVRGCPDNPCSVSDCRWSQWEGWSGCTSSCGGGQRFRSRFIEEVPTNGGSACAVEVKEEITPCNTQDCSVQVCLDGNWGPWHPWAPCSASCGGGNTFRTRKIRRMANVCGKEPEGEDRETAFCNLDACEESVDCVLSAWGQWTHCSASCNGIMRRSRGVERYGRGKGAWCLGPLKEIWPCLPGEGGRAPEGCTGSSPVDCLLSPWAGWSGCSASCGVGQRIRSRDVVQPPAHGGAGCRGGLSEIVHCAERNCTGPHPVDCMYGDWQDWGACGKCSGEMKRFRTIVRYAQHGGRNCGGVSAEEVAACPRQCQESMLCAWKDWGDWNDCTASCGSGGSRKRRRYLYLTRGTKDAVLSVADVMSKYESLYQRTKELETHHIHELLVSFVGGCVSLLAAVASLRVFSLARHACCRSGAGGRPRVAAALQSGLSHEMGTELPLVSVVRRG